MTNREAMRIANGKTPDCSREEIRQAWQHLVDTGAVWSMGNWYSQMASCMLEAGTLERNAA